MFTANCAKLPLTILWSPGLPRASHPTSLFGSWQEKYKARLTEEVPLAIRFLYVWFLCVRFLPLGSCLWWSYFWGSVWKFLSLSEVLPSGFLSARFSSPRFLPTSGFLSVIVLFMGSCMWGSYSLRFLSVRLLPTSGFLSVIVLFLGSCMWGSYSLMFLSVRLSLWVPVCEVPLSGFLSGRLLSPSGSLSVRMNEDPTRSLTP